MIIFKSSISRVIRREREKVRKSCEAEYAKKIKSLKRDLEKSNSKKLNIMKSEYVAIIEEKDREIEKLISAIDTNYKRYIQVRRREKQLDNLSNEIEDVIENMVTKVHESVQPFYRTRAKVLATKKISDKNHDGVKNILVLNK
ncbi:MAG: hypothetical protein CVV49_18600 [Spirochaetae bacterium HGW-Spirochaetae-5]|nr:MAG: hypothetical protein CVV49_18600 [Spirochaetae bacterium HGW-Spirochaetae-5]